MNLDSFATFFQFCVNSSSKHHLVFVIFEDVIYILRLCTGF